MKYTKYIFALWTALSFVELLMAQTDSTNTALRDQRNALQNSKHALKLPNSNTKTTVTYDPISKKYKLVESIGGVPTSITYLTFEEYLKYEAEKSKKQNWQNNAKTNGGSQAFGNDRLIPKLYVGPKVFDKIFGGNAVDIRPQGNAELRFALNHLRNENPGLTTRQQRITQFDFKQNIQMNVTASIGEKMKFTANQNTQAIFNFDNRIKLHYTGQEDEIVKNIEAGNVSLPLRGTLIQGSQTLMGIKTELQFGKLRSTTVLSQQQGRNNCVTVQNGAQSMEFNIPADEYDANRHFFLAHYFRENYNRAMARIPIIQSQAQITRVEVWVTRGNSQSAEVRDIVAFTDLGENTRLTDNQGVVNILNNQPFPFNDANDLFYRLTNNTPIRQSNTTLGAIEQDQNLNKLTNTLDYELTFARKLTLNEYTFNPQLGYISLNSPLNNDEVLGVAFEYTINGKVYRVGEFSTEILNEQNNPTAIYLKLLKGTTIRTQTPMWDLMMKNIYTLNTFNLGQQDFQLNVVYTDVLNGYKNFLPEGPKSGQLLLQLLGLDRLNVQQEPTPDGFFDFIPGLTVQIQNGRIIFPKIEPFGNDLKDAFTQNGQLNDALWTKYAYPQLYDSTRAWAQQFPQNNRFRLKGRYQGSSGQEIILNAFNIPPNSVKVRAGNRQLTEGVDFNMDYDLGRLRLLQAGLTNSGEVIEVCYEENQMANPQPNALIAQRFDYQAAKNFALGSTILHLGQRPFTQKVNQGQEPVSNTVVGLDGSYTTESRYLTRLIDKLPLLQTKEPSNIAIIGEYAHLFPGSSKVIQSNGSKEEPLDKNGISYIDDFEGTRNAISMTQFNQWHVASTPSTLAEATLRNDLRNGKNRAHLSWFQIDPIFFGNVFSNDIITTAMQSNQFMRQVTVQEVFPNRQLNNTQPGILPTFDLAFYPKERGSYNFNADQINASGELKNPKQAWAGIQRRILNNDFEANNIEYIEFWMMDPYIDNPQHQGGDLYFDLGTVSEDVLKDGRRFYENGLPKNPNNLAQIDSTAWGYVPRLQPIVNAFDNDPAARIAQDVGYDGMNSAKERQFFNNFVNQAQNTTSPNAFEQIQKDPANDDYHHFRGTDYDNERLDIVQRYKHFNKPEGNSPVPEQTNEPFPTVATNIPNNEDINQDNALSQVEAYYEYKVSMRKDDLKVGTGYVVDKVITNVRLKNGTNRNAIWYQFRIPIQKPDKKVGNITDYKSIRFMRMYLTNFEETVNCRFATLQLVRTDWRRYTQSLQKPGELVPIDDQNRTSFVVSTVNIEENGQKSPIRYIVPPGIQRQQNAFSPNTQLLNEQSLRLDVCNLEDGDARATFKNSGFDIRAYKRIKMFVHAEGKLNTNNTIDVTGEKQGEMTAFIRFGNDFVNNYYEIEIPLKPSNISTTNPSNPDNVWLKQNRFDITFEVLQAAKSLRNRQNIDYATDFITLDSTTSADGVRQKITIHGNPNLGNIQVMMLGVRNPKRTNNQDDGEPKCGEIWFNELRLTDFDQRSGWAATSTANIRLADVGTVSVSGALKTVGYGGITSRPAERSREDSRQMDAASQLELGKFIPERFGWSIPMNLGYSKALSTPEYNPYNSDILLKTALAEASNQAEQDSLTNISQTTLTRRAIGFNNVRKNRTQNPNANAKPRKNQLWDIENFAFNYTYSQILKTDPFVKFNDDRQYRGGITYNFNTNPKMFAPFEKTIKNKHLAFIRDLNINLIPSTISIRADIERRFNEIQLRNTTADASGDLPSYINKNFVMHRMFTVRHDLTKSIHLDLDILADARIDEPNGKIDTQLKKDTVLANLKKLGRTTSYKQDFNATYNLPFNKFTFLDWCNGNIRYNARYEWRAAPRSAIELGNTITNAQTQQLNVQANFSSLYNKSKILRKVMSDEPFVFEKKKKETPKDDKNKNPKPELEQTKDEKIDKNNIVLEKGKLEKGKKEDSTPIKKIDKNGKPLTKRELAEQQKKQDEKNKKKTKNQFGEDIDDDNNIKIGQNRSNPSQNNKPDFNLANFMLKGTGRLLLSVKNVALTYSTTKGIGLPGFVPEANYLGNDFSLDAPGLPFIFGNQTDLRPIVQQQQWLTLDTNLMARYGQSNQVNLSGRMSLEPFKDFRIELTNTYNGNANIRDNFKAGNNGRVTSFAPIDSGNFSMSIIAWRTSFDKLTKAAGIDGKNYQSAAYDQFLDSRRTIAQRLAAENPNSTGIDSLGFPSGYSRKSPDVLIPAFLAAYTGQNPNGVSTNPLKPNKTRLPLPNWRITYTGLSNLPFVQKFAQNININHSYRATYTMSSFISNLYFLGDANGKSINRDTTGRSLGRLPGDFYSKNKIETIQINEQFAPFIGIDITLKNSLTARFEYNKSRNITLGLNNARMTESRNNDLTIGIGYRLKTPNLPITINGKPLQNDINMRFDFTMRDNVTILRDLDGIIPQAQQGMKVFSIRPSMDYQVNNRVTARLFWDQNINVPVVANTYRNANVNAGLSIRFTIL